MHNEPGRPRALTPEKLKRLIDMAARGMTIAEGAERIGCSAKTVQRERRRCALFDYLLSEAQRGRREARRWAKPPPTKSPLCETSRNLVRMLELIALGAKSG